MALLVFISICNLFTVAGFYITYIISLTPKGIRLIILNMRCNMKKTLLILSLAVLMTACAGMDQQYQRNMAVNAAGYGIVGSAVGAGIAAATHGSVGTGAGIGAAAGALLGAAGTPPPPGQYASAPPAPYPYQAYPSTYYYACPPPPVVYYGAPVVYAPVPVFYGGWGYYGGPRYYGGYRGYYGGHGYRGYGGGYRGRHH
jgi:hypothetical protein